MASSYPAPVSAAQVGSYFVQQYYQVLQQQPDFVHQFYTDASAVLRIDGDSTESASERLQIHTLILSLNFTGIEIKTINSLESWKGGVLVVVSGSVKSKDFSGWRKFMQTFLLAPQETGYFVLNDIFHFVNEEVIHQHPASMVPDNKLDSQQTTSSTLAEPPVSDYALEVEAREYVNSVHIEGDDRVDEYSLQEQQQQQDPEAEDTEEETPVEESSALLQNADESVQEPLPAMEESIGEPPKLTYASILRAPKGKYVASVATQPSFTKSTPPASEWNQIPPASEWSQTPPASDWNQAPPASDWNQAPPASDWNQMPQPTVQQSNSISSFAPDSSVEVAEEALSQEEEGESKSVYVRNLSSTVSTIDIVQEFKNFGRIKTDGVFLRNRKDSGVCYAFVEFEDVQSVQNAIKASPIQLAGRQVYIEGRRANSGSTSRGGRRGRGRGSYQHEAPRGRFGGRTFGRGSNQDGGDNNRLRGNGFRGS